MSQHALGAATTALKMSCPVNQDHSSPNMDVLKFHSRLLQTPSPVSSFNTPSQPHLLAPVHLYFSSFSNPRSISLLVYLIKNPNTSRPPIYILLCIFSQGGFFSGFCPLDPVVENLNAATQTKEYHLDNNLVCGNSLRKALSCFNMKMPL